MTAASGPSSRLAPTSGSGAGGLHSPTRTGEAEIAPLWRALPNWLTASRVMMATVFFVILTLWRYDDSRASRGETDWLLIASALLFVVATLTDALDGYLARRWGVESLLGRIMDPFADKLLVLGALIFMAGPDFWWRFPGEHVARFSGHGLQISGIYPWMVVVVVARELLVTSMRGVLEAQGVKFGASWPGKLKMIFQSVAIPAILGLVALTPVLPTFDAGTGPGVRPWGRDAIDVIAWSMVGVTILSGLPYVWRALRMLSEIRAEVREHKHTGGAAERADGGDA